MLPHASLSSVVGGPVAVQPLVLVVADDASRRRALVFALAAGGFRSLEAYPGSAALSRAIRYAPDLVLVDMRRTTAEGSHVVAHVREGTSAPILVMSMQPDEISRAAVLNAGASDYIDRTFGVEDLAVRIRRWLGRTARPLSERPPVDGPRVRLRLDGDRRAIVVDGREVHLTPIERKLVGALVQCAGGGMSETQAVAVVWGKSSPTHVRYLRLLIRQLRQKMEREPARPRHLLSTAQGGYRLKCD